MAKWSQVQAKEIDDNAVREALRQLAGSAMACNMAIKNDMDFEAIVAEVDNMRTHLGLVQSACSVKFLSQMIKREKGNG